MSGEMARPAARFKRDHDGAISDTRSAAMWCSTNAVIAARGDAARATTERSRDGRRDARRSTQ